MTDVSILYVVEPSAINADIRLLLEYGLSELAKRQSIEQGVWSTDQDLDLLCERVGGLFVYAVATLELLDHVFTSSSKRLDIIARAPRSTTHEGKAIILSRATLGSFDNITGIVSTLRGFL